MSGARPTTSRTHPRARTLSLGARHCAVCTWPLGLYKRYRTAGWSTRRQGQPVVVCALHLSLAPNRLQPRQLTHAHFTAHGNATASPPHTPSLQALPSHTEQCCLRGDRPCLVLAWPPFASPAGPATNCMPTHTCMLLRKHFPHPGLSPPLPTHSPQLLLLLLLQQHHVFHENCPYLTAGDARRCQQCLE